jgi:hypothetical protein
MSASCVLVAAFLLASASAFAQETQGFAEFRAQMNLGVDGQPLQVVERLRPTFTKGFSERLSLTATIEAGLAEGRNLQDEVERTVKHSRLGQVLKAEGWTWAKDKNEFFDVSSPSDYLRVDRLYLDGYLKSVDLRLGRQAVNWGSAIIVNPTDPFPEVLATQPWLPRAGVDALRATVPVGEKHQLQAVVGTDDTFTAVRVAGRATFNLDLTDLSLVSAWRQEAKSGIVGLDVRGTLGVGYWLEGSLHLRPEAQGDPYEELAVGADYSFPVGEKLVVSAQYYRNGAGSPRPGAATLASGLRGVRWPTRGAGAQGIDGGFDPRFPRQSNADPFAPFFLGRDYGMLSANLAATTDLSFSGLWIQNLGDGSGLVVPVVTYTPTGRLELSAAAQIPFSLWGSGGELHPNDRQLELSVDTGTTSEKVDFSGLVPDAVVTVWTRVNF